MKKYLILLLILMFAFSIMGCQDNYIPGEKLAQAERELEELQRLLEEEQNASQNSQSKTTISLKVDEFTLHNDNAKIYITVQNSADREYFISSLDFTLTKPSSVTINPTSSSVQSFEGITLQPHQKMVGYLEFDGLDEDGVYKLNFNHREYPSSLSLRK